MTRTVPNQFATLTSPLEANLDADFVAVAPGIVVPCTATGTNAYTLTPFANTMVVSSYSDQEQYSFEAPATSAAGVTIAIGTLPSVNLYQSDGATQASSGDVAANLFYQIAYQSYLNAGAGGFVIVNQLNPANALDIISAVQGSILYRGSSVWQALAPSATPGLSLQTQGPGSNPVWGSGGVSQMHQQSYFTPGTFTFSTPSGTGITTVYKATVTAAGAGGNGDGAGGGAGATAIHWFSGLSNGTSIAVTIGSGSFGAGAATTSSGGPSVVSVGGITVVVGGGGGASSSFGGQGGIATGAVINLMGGGAAPPNSGLTQQSIGGASYWGGGGPGASQAPPFSISGVAPGTGGGGSTSVTGGSGAPGAALFEWLQ
jgi:hypothetical protein